MLNEKRPGSCRDASFVSGTVTEILFPFHVKFVPVHDSLHYFLPRLSVKVAESEMPDPKSKSLDAEFNLVRPPHCTALHGFKCISLARYAAIP